MQPEVWWPVGNRAIHRVGLLGFFSEIDEIYHVLNFGFEVDIVDNAAFGASEEDGGEIQDALYAGRDHAYENLLGGQIRG